MKKTGNHVVTFLLVLVLLAGVSLLLYPTVSDYINSLHQSQAITNYTEQVARLDQKEYDTILRKARKYNKKILKRSNPYVLNDKEKEDYNSTLNIAGDGVMGYVEVPSIKCSLPIYHGTSEASLQVAIGHLEWTSLPIGGESTHCVLSGHRGLPAARLFTDLDKLVEGDIFILRVLDEVVTYEVDQILIVEPDEIDALRIEEGKDYCTLVTCTPYGVNTHRLLVRGHRIDNVEQSKRIHVTADAMQIDPFIVAPVVALPMLLILLLILLLRKPKKSQRGEKDEDIKKRN